MTHRWTWRRQALWPIPQPVTRWQSSHSGFTFMEQSCRPSLYRVIVILYLFIFLIPLSSALRVLSVCVRWLRHEQWTGGSRGSRLSDVFDEEQDSFWLRRGLKDLATVVLGVLHKTKFLSCSERVFRLWGGGGGGLLKFHWTETNEILFVGRHRMTHLRFSVVEQICTCIEYLQR